MYRGQTALASSIGGRGGKREVALCISHQTSARYYLVTTSGETKMITSSCCAQYEYIAGTYSWQVTTVHNLYWIRCYRWKPVKVVAYG